MIDDKNFLVDIECSDELEHRCCVQMDRIEVLSAENERLREALRDVVECDPGSYEATIARAALGEKK